MSELVNFEIRPAPTSEELDVMKRQMESNDELLQKIQVLLGKKDNVAPSPSPFTRGRRSSADG